MIKWKGYSEATGENIEFCCPAMEHCYKEQHISYDVTVGKYCIRLPRRTKREVIRMEVGVVPGIEDNFVIDYCMFCGKNIYKDDLRFDTTGPGWGGHWNTYICGRAANMNL